MTDRQATILKGIVPANHFTTSSGWWYRAAVRAMNEAPIVVRRGDGLARLEAMLEDAA
jgi:hypothetical protein